LVAPDRGSHVRVDGLYQTILPRELQIGNDPNRSMRGIASPSEAALDSGLARFRIDPDHIAIDLLMAAISHADEAGTKN
jgi:hypothetical protein